MMSRQPPRGKLLGRLSGSARYAGRMALDVLLPPSCVACDQPVAAPGQLCAECYRRTSFITEPYCRRCGVPFGHPSQGGLDQLCPSCRAAEPAFDRARAAFLYDKQSRRLILPFKYADRTEIAAALAPHMARAGALLLEEADVLVPVPLHPSRLFRRRYNQAALLARALARTVRKPSLPDALVRVRATTPLAEMSAEERQLEVAGVFAVRPSRAERIAGRRVIAGGRRHDLRRNSRRLRHGATPSRGDRGRRVDGGTHAGPASHPLGGHGRSGGRGGVRSFLNRHMPDIHIRLSPRSPSTTGTHARDRDLHSALVRILRPRGAHSGTKRRAISGDRRAARLECQEAGDAALGRPNHRSANLHQ
jgi:predicted amidophosphoribosyltransferase